ncbi:hypothetical protein PIB30_099767 [Stylosanthes scabra]|uniref:Ubiquitin-like protease family profile domain-containing protein n=1 Tax=Stylosanthes scabra TaxID=79078 RepID=A0ABU6SXG3_9FABA|nr:hypothetical protein [Stylosanthes scabra]
MLETHGHNWMDKKKKKPHDIGTLKNHEEYMGYLDKDKLLTHRFCNVLDQMLRWDGASSMFKKGTHSLLPRYINIPRQPNEYDYGVYVMKWMELIDPTVLIDCSKGNKEYNIETSSEPNAEQCKCLEVGNNKESKRNTEQQACSCSSKPICSSVIH